MFRQFIVKVAMGLAQYHTDCAGFWNDVAEAFLIGESLSALRARKQREQDRD